MVNLLVVQIRTCCWLKGSGGISHQSAAGWKVFRMATSAGTFTRILPFSASGDGSWPNTSALMLDRSNLSPKISVKYCAIFFCWGTLQWFSMDRMMGYLTDSRTQTCDEDPHKSSAETFSSSYSFKGLKTTLNLCHWSCSLVEASLRHALFVQKDTSN